VRPRLLQQILAAHPGLSKGQRRAADYLYHHYDEAVFLTAGQIAARIGLSTSTVTRLARPLGYQGFPQLQEAFRNLVRAERSTVSRLEDATAGRRGGRDVVAEVFASDVENLQRTHKDVDRAALVRAAEAITGARHVYVVGLRSAHGMAVVLHFGLQLTLGTSRLLVPGIGDLPEQAAELRPGDVLVAISFARYTRQTYEVLVQAKERGARTIVITDKATSPLAQQGDVALVARTDLKSIIESYVAPLSLVNALVTLIASRNPRRSMRRLAQFEERWKEARLYL
jgi:DNA-binding MurR/RpiR family transcriptional regulator